MAKSKKVTKKGTRAATAEKRAPKTNGGTIPLKKVCQELGLDPKASRVRLRRAWRREGEDNLAFHEKGRRWDLTPKEAKEVRAILSA